MATTRLITSRSNPTVKALRALSADAREQRRQGRTLLDGPHLVAAYLERVGRPERLLVSESGLADAEVRQLLAAIPATDVIEVSDGLFREISGITTPVGLLAVIAIPEAPSALAPGACVLLDAIQDAGNVGTIMRTAAAAGIGQVALGPGCAGAWTPRVLRAAQGAHFNLRILEQADLLAIVQINGQDSIAAVARDGVPLYQLDLAGDVAWIFGNEGLGVSPALAALAARRATIPMAAGSESLNVAAAAAVCIFEGLRQQLLKRGKS